MPPPAGAPDLSVSEFLRGLALSRVIDDARAEQLVAEAPPECKAEPAKLADHLVALGELTPFQADRLLRGRWRGLTLGPYRLLSPLGRGGMGVVYLARGNPDPATGTAPLVALKVLPPQRAKEEPQTLARFEREKELGQRLPPHPHLARTLDAGEQSGVHYLAMEYVLGRTVRQLVSESGPLPVGKAARAFADVASGLHQAHAAGFVHRDLKPSNVMITPEGRAKLLDFGLALSPGETAWTDPASLSGQAYRLGTADYMSPEQSADPTAVGPATDLYALGCSLYFALTGTPPFPGGTPADKVKAHRTATAPAAAQLNPAVPPELSRLVYRLMAKTPAGRPASAEEVAAELGRWADPVRPEWLGGLVTESAEALRLADANWRAEQGGEPDVYGFAAEDEGPIILGDGEAKAEAVMVLPVVAPAVPVAVPLVKPAKEAARPEKPPAGKPSPQAPAWFPAAAAAAGLLAVSAAVALGWALARATGP